METANCDVCGTSFRRKRRDERPGRYCSNACWHKARSLRVTLRPGNIPAGHREAAAARVGSQSTVAANGCWIWHGRMNNNGYGMLMWNGWRGLAHRLSYMAAKGDIPDGCAVCHTCDTPTCVNPDHLFAGTINDNNQDMLRKGRHVSTIGRRTAKYSEAQAMGVIAADPKLGLMAHRARVAAAAIGVPESFASNVLRGITWNHVTGLPIARRPSRNAGGHQTK